jgi:hypothetical protein
MIRPFQAFDYQRLVVAYHGCDHGVRDQVIQSSKPLAPSANDYDWLGHGIYFWEHGPERAWAWAENQAKRGRIRKPAVLGALLHLGQCFDLLDSRYTELLATTFEDFKASLDRSGIKLPLNQPLGPDDPDRILRKLDCAAINWTIEEMEKSSSVRFHSVRCVFPEGEPVFPESGIHRRSHIQIAVRDPACIIGYFLPS